METMLAPPDPTIHLAQHLEDFVRRASEAPLPDPLGAERLAARAVAGDAGARDSLVRAHLRLVVDEAIRYRGVGDRMRDLVPQAFDALVDAAREYRPPSDEGFTAYARRSIRSALTGRYGPH